MGSYVAPNAMRNPDGSPSYVVCEGTICTNPNHGAADPGSDSDADSPDSDRPNDSPVPDADPGDDSPVDAPAPQQPTVPEQLPGDDGPDTPGVVDDGAGPSADEPAVDEP